MGRGGMRGIEPVLFTGKILIEVTPIGAGTMQANVMTRDFIMSTIVGRAPAGRKGILGEPTLRDMKDGVTMIDETG
jgi:hypothetical protein